MPHVRVWVERLRVPDWRSWVRVLGVVRGLWARDVDSGRGDWEAQEKVSGARGESSDARGVDALEGLGGGGPAGIAMPSSESSSSDDESSSALGSGGGPAGISISDRKSVV